ncbi:flagellar hook assembly protein FlgD [Robbsia sp. Bb-Pol-6]|uniref:Basal-body rod modification protein FlgD n=1 Tax=Robbsia betulipollinis TaxID=2981849 RepID=A0ABT3ZJ71_9BURK|nr:flagellar hook assembly protein FlgD [Robbsia betulipollinis]MCY0386015.1 flagellar hook assembly protein FlgD [Robbsia betulipollinis]
MDTISSSSAVTNSAVPKAVLNAVNGRSAGRSAEDQAGAAAAAGAVAAAGAPGAAPEAGAAGLGEALGGAAGALSKSTGAPGSTKSAADMQSTFMKLLTTEMKNQDPTNPMDSSQMTSQLAQINTVSGIAGLNTTLSSLATQLNATQQVSASALIGKSVLANGNGIQVAAGKASAFGMQLTAPASAVKVTVVDAGGHPVRSMALESKETGMTPLSWDGKDDTGKTVADGSYTFKVSASNGADPVSATALSQSKVNSIVQQPNGTAGLMLGNGATTSLSSVAQIL